MFALSELSLLGLSLRRRTRVVTETLDTWERAAERSNTRTV
jgi:hypothetical protein